MSEGSFQPASSGSEDEAQLCEQSARLFLGWPTHFFDRARAADTEQAQNACAKELAAFIRRHRDMARATPPRDLAAAPGGGETTRKLLAEAVELFELDEEATTPGTDTYTWLTLAREHLATPVPDTPPADAGLVEALKKLDGDSLDAICEVIGEGPDFRRYNEGKSAMRQWFLRRIEAALSRATGGQHV